jgi:hypothetical protein
MQISNPAAVAQIQQAGGDAENARVQGLIVAFASDPTFLQSCVADKTMTVEKAKAAQFDKVKAENDSLKATAVKTPKQPKVGYASSDKPAAKSGTTPVGTEDAAREEAAAVWNANEQLRTEFGGQFNAFVADYKNHPEDYGN